MIQRIQSLLLLLAAMAMGALFFLPVAHSDSTSGVFADGIYDTNDDNIYLVATIIAVIIALVSIFLFKNRKAQLITVLAFGAVCGFVVGFLAVTLFVSLKDLNPTLSLGMIAPVLAIILALTASNFIKKDDNLVRSMDRLR